MKKINWDIIFLNTLSESANLFINKKFLAKYGLDIAVFISFLINQYKYYNENNKLIDDKMFYATNEDIYLFTNMPRTRITSIKQQATKLGIISTKQLGIPAKTYYKINFELLVDVLSTESNVQEIAYARTLTTTGELNSEYLEKLTYNELRLLCKKNKISYSGKSKKIDLINLIIQDNNSNSESTNNCGTDKWVEKSPTERIPNNCGTDKWVEKSPTSEQKNYPLVGGKVAPNHNIKKHNINKHNINHDNHDVHDFFEKLFKEQFKINYTTTNRNSINKLLKTLSFNEVKDYLMELYKNLSENKKVNNIPALFSKKLKAGERQINKIPQPKVPQNTFETKKVDYNKTSIYTELGLKNDLDEYEQMKIEELAIEKYLEKHHDMSGEELAALKYTDKNNYYGILHGYILNIINSNKGELLL
ncbi:MULTISPECIES: hypothetical protein [unclassified Fusobacterium]|uniref:hypothetical protein n=1 Tax=unclassified Fusobacterium TaxID=2648384 RepID=UPI001B8B175B|nr:MULTISPECIES: hypothetical protein [unclassified Fusobacterium]MBR8701033.1 hypothetical protein [Fusobacterium sp. DD45]MBR8710805.1 hypothetical protein [Fusobacterium sp. DD28]MBR8751417.1 hypothetical protein [Fusobacterium sp. DD26]